MNTTAIAVPAMGTKSALSATLGRIMHPAISARVSLAVATLALSAAAVAAVICQGTESPAALATLCAGAAIGLPALFIAVRKGGEA